MSRSSIGFVFVVGVAVSLCGCGGQDSGGAGSDASGAGFRPIDASAAVFWDRQTTETAELLRTLADEFNATRGGLLPVKVEHSGGYSDIFRKVTVAIQAGALPSMAVAYQSMTAEYVQAGAVVDLDTFATDPQKGLSQEDRDDFFPVVLETNRYPQLGGKMYSFPFCKSVVMLYFNKRVLTQAGFDAPPKTWDEFLHQCRTIKEKTGRAAYAINVDCSTIAGMIFSMGGEVVDGMMTLYDSPASLKTFQLIETLAKEELAYQIAPSSYDDQVALSQDSVAFVMRSSSSRTGIKMLMEGRQDQWGMAMIPQDDPAHPKTVLYGPNICIFNTTKEQQEAGWDFVKYFTSKEIVVRWALGTGYLPIRKSVANHPDLQRFWGEWPYNKAAFDCLPFAKSEPNLAGWQDVRKLVETAESEILTGKKTAAEAVSELKKQADAVLSLQK